MRLKKFLGFVLLIFSFESEFDPEAKVYAYPNYITYGYQSCLSCHYNPYGNGPLTDYGRAVSATAISDRRFWNEKTSEEEVADRSGFFFAKPHIDWLRPSLSYRGLYLKRNADKAGSKDDFIPMDLSGALVAKFLERDSLTVVGQLAYAPKPFVRKNILMDLYRSREHYIGYRFSKQVGFYLGLMDKVFGIRVPDHIAFSRMVTGLAQNDQTHGGLLHFLSKDFEFGVQSFVGNLAQDAQGRHVGITSQLEYSVARTARIGASALQSKSKYTKNRFYALHARAGWGEGHSVLAELGSSNKEFLGSGTAVNSQYVFTQTHLALHRGAYGLITAEYYRPDSSQQPLVLRLGPGLQYFPLQRLELRADAYHTKGLAGGKETYATWDLSGQIHLWF